MALLSVTGLKVGHEWPTHRLYQQPAVAKTAGNTDPHL